MLRFLFGSGGWIAWYVVLWLCTAFVGLLHFALVRETVPRPAGPASLGSVYVVVQTSGFLGLITLIHAVPGLRALGAPWWGAVIGAVLLCVGVAWGVYKTGERVCEIGGYGWCATNVVLCIGVFVANLWLLSAWRESLRAARSTPPPLPIAIG